MRLVICLTLYASALALADAPRVELLKAPHDGYRPQAIVDAAGVLHVVQVSATSRGDLFYLKRKPGEAFSKPIKVNTAAGITASFSFALGKGGRVHVLIRPNPRYLKLKMPEKKKFIFWDLKYMLYCRLNDAGTAFEEERDLSGALLGFEGVGTVLADQKDTVYAFFHGQAEAKPGEAARHIYRVVSTDGGKSFSAPVAIKAEVDGACQCCPMRGALAADGVITLAYRNAQLIDAHSVTKDSYLLTSKDGGLNFDVTFLDGWKAAGCPGSTYALNIGPTGTYVAWRTKMQVKFTRMSERLNVISPTTGANTRVPVLACNKEGTLLFAWGVRTKRRQPGHIVWQLYDKQGKALGQKQVKRQAVSARFGSLAAVALPDGSFLVLYDGPGEPAGSK